MQTLRNLVLSAASGACFLFCAPPLLPQITREPTDMDRRFARHFSEKPPVQFEIVEGAEHRPRMIITNRHQWSLTAYVLQTEPISANDTRQTLICDAGGIACPYPQEP